MSSRPEAVRRPKRREPSARYHDRRAAILDTATKLLNRNGVSGMTFADVARSLSLSTTSINYYFGAKEVLATAIISESLERLDAIVKEAQDEAEPRARVRRYVTLYLDLCRSAASDECRPFANLSEIRSLEDSSRIPLQQRYQQIFRDVRELFSSPARSADKAGDTARTHILNETLFWAERWISRYATGDYAGVTARLYDILDGGIAPDGVTPNAVPAPLELPTSPRKSGEASFLPAATRLINKHGYRGASIERIAAELKVTKGSFYHHLATKDELVLECFQQSYHRTMALLSERQEEDTSAWVRLGSGLSALIDLQFTSPFPLTRSSALQAMPETVRTIALTLLERTALHIAGALVEGMKGGSIRLVDSAIASQMLLSAVNASYDARNWALRLGAVEARRTYVSVLQYGLFDARVC